MLHIRHPESALSYSKGSRGLFVPLRVGGIFTATTISPSSRLRQCPDRYTIRAGRNLPDKEFRYLRTVIVTAAVYRGLSPPLNLPSPGRCQAIFVILTISHSHVFLVNSRLGHFSAPYSRRVPLSRSYGVNLPSSLAVIHSSTLGFSPHPPVSVYGTGRHTLNALAIFLRVCLPALSDRRSQLAPTPFNALFRQRAAVSLPGLALACMAGARILTGSPLRSPLGLRLGPGSP